MVDKWVRSTYQKVKGVAHLSVQFAVGRGCTCNFGRLQVDRVDQNVESGQRNGSNSINHVCIVWLQRTKVNGAISGELFDKQTRNFAILHPLTPN